VFVSIAVPNLIAGQRPEKRVSLSHLRSLATAVILSSTLLSSGCGPDRVQKQAPVNVTVAESTLVKVLDAWKSGQKPDELAKQSPKIVAQDMDWVMGAKLADYKVTGNNVPKDANLISEVELNLVAPDGKEKKKTVKYIVGTSPVLTVFRQMMD
jgi:hypothetical protein